MATNTSSKKSFRERDDGDERVVSMRKNQNSPRNSQDREHNEDNRFESEGDDDSRRSSRSAQGSSPSSSELRSGFPADNR